MKKFVTGLFLLMGLHGWGQVDTLEFTTRRELADNLFGLLNPDIYKGALVDRCLTEDPILNMQLVHGDYSDTASAWSWLQAYSDIALCYVNPEGMFSDSVLYDRLAEFQESVGDINNNSRPNDDVLVQPFGLLLHNINRIKGDLFSVPGVFSNSEGRLKLNDGYNEPDIYSKVLLKSAALLELYAEHGYSEGIIVYDPQFISTSPDIKIESIWLDMGNGFQEFSATNTMIKYPITADWQIGQAAIKYDLDGELKQDTLSFYVSTQTYKYKNLEKSGNPWDTGNQFFPRDGKKDLKYRIKFACNSERKIRRPVIIAPPYRPGSQDVSFDEYYDQFNFHSLITLLTEKGYDVIFIKETPGNRGINHAGGVLADFIKYINQEKKTNYPDEDWENVVIGFSAGGQHWRYALKKLEKEHMEQNLPHHHTRLYIPFDSPHWGANVPMFAQAVFKDMSAFHPFAYLTYNSLKDAASKDMLMNHILGSNISVSGHDRTITPAPTAERMNIVNLLDNAFNHQFTPMNDLRRSFPTFTRNVAVSTGSNFSDYNSSYGLYPGMKLFKQETMVPAWYGGRTIKRSIYASKYGNGWPVFERKDLYVFLGIPYVTQRYYKTNGAYEWDMAQGGYKDEFYDKEGYFTIGSFTLNIPLPISAVSILEASSTSVIGGGLSALGNTQYYKNHMSFLPMVSALGINPSIWNNNHLYYNLKNEGLLFNEFGYTTPSDTYGYPNLAHPTNHFNITPFEAIYCDPQTYEHIKMQASVDEDHLDEMYLLYTRNFILDEVEADIVYLQNKVIGKNHVQWDPNYRYKAWYKARNQVVFGESVTPKTDLGPYVIEKTGEITAYACNGVTIKPGFHAQSGSKFHAFAQCDDCYGNKKSATTPSGNGQNTAQAEPAQGNVPGTAPDAELNIFPNPTTDRFTVVFPQASGQYCIGDLNGRILEYGQVREENKTYSLRLPKGVYYITWFTNGGTVTKKIIVL